MAEVTITRTLFRSGDSEYAINGAPCRLLDIQELLNDSGVGRQQHMIIGQGQLDTVLNARPEDRRAIIEEAAGVLKHRRRRERAERRLAATQENLERLGDLVREVRRQIRPLERQAAAARSHATVAAELRAVRLHVAATELAELAGRKTAAAEALAALGAEERDLRAAVTGLDEAATATAAELSSSREVDLASALGRVQGLVERTRGTSGVLRERARGLAAALDAAADVDVVSTLEAESARLAAELAAAEEESAALAPERNELAAAEEALAFAERAHLQTWGDGAELAAAEEELSAARGRLELLRRALDQDRRTLSGLDERTTALRQRHDAVSAARAELARRSGELLAEAERLVAEAAGAEAADGRARAEAAESERAAYAAEQERHRSAARAEALARALHELEGAGGREALEGVEGVVGSLVDLVEIDATWESAFEAAVGAAVAAVVVDGRGAARAALSRLHTKGATGALLAAGRSPAPTPGALPAGAEPVRAHVRVRRGGHAVEGVLDALLGRAVRVDGWEQALDLALDRPDLVVVTADGDRFAESGWRIRPSTGVVTAAAVEEAGRQAAEAERTAEQAAHRLAGARRAAEETRAAVVAATRAVDRNESSRTAAAAEAERTAEEQERLASELEGTLRARQESAAGVDADAASLAECEAAVPVLEAGVASASSRAAEADAARSVLDRQRAELAAQVQALEVRSAGLSERARVLAARRFEVERRLEGHADEREAAAARRRRLEAEGVALQRLEGLVEGERERLEGVLEALRVDYRLQVEAVRAGGERLEALRRDRADAESRLSEVRERTRALDLEATEVALRSEALAETVQRELGSDPAEALEAPAPEVPEGVTPAQHAARLAEQLAALGPVNPLALDELSVLEERHRELDAQVDDVRSARRELQDVVRTLDEEIMQSFAAAAADVNEHFSALVVDPLPRGDRPAHPHRARRPPQHRGRGGGPAGRAQRPAGLAALRRGAVAGRPGLPLRRLPEPAVPLLPDGRGRSGPRRRQPPPVLGPRARVPRRGAADHREPPEAHHGDRRRPLRGDHGPRRLLAGHQPEGGQGARSGRRLTGRDVAGGQ